MREVQVDVPAKALGYPELNFHKTWALCVSLLAFRSSRLGLLRPVPVKNKISMQADIIRIASVRNASRLHVCAT
jgi:hypothetical protein